MMNPPVKRRVFSWLWDLKSSEGPPGKLKISTQRGWLTMTELPGAVHQEHVRLFLWQAIKKMYLI